jgi:hypothetical protein
MAPAGRPLASVSIDVDPLPCYYRIHGLGPAPDALRDVVLRRALPRFAELLASRGIAATFFLVAEDVDLTALGARARAARALTLELVRAGHEIGNHSYAHPYELARLGAAARDEIRRAHDVLSDAAGHPIRGFRATGYDLSRDMLAALVELGYAYDSSLFPAPGYYLAKAAVMAALALAGRPSGAVLTDPRALLARPAPYRPALASPWRRGTAPLIELPIATSPWLRIPAIGTSLLLAPDRVRRHLIAAMAGRPHFNFELHGIDLIDAEEDGIPGALVARQPDLRVPLATKRAALLASLDLIRDRFEVRRLDQAAAHFAATL